MVREILTFGLVGAVGLAVDIGLFNLLFSHGQIVAKCVSTAAATALTYIGNRYLSFSHRTRSGLARETSAFISVNIFALAASLAILGAFEYPLGFKGDLLVMNGVNIVTIGIGTVFRFYCYKRVVWTTSTARP